MSFHSWADRTRILKASKAKKKTAIRALSFRDDCNVIDDYEDFRPVVLEKM